MSSRDMQIEFERRISLMDESFLVDGKLTSDTIFSFLNAFTERYVKQNYLLADAAEPGTRVLRKLSDVIKSLVVRTILDKAPVDELDTDMNSTKFILPKDYFLYLRSTSLVSSTYRGLVDTSKGNYLEKMPNVTTTEDSINNVLSTYNNRAIIRKPFVVLNDGRTDDDSADIYLNVIHDTYTTVENVELIYCRKPRLFNVIGVDGVNVLDHCELPVEAHIEIVEGAVEMFITEAKYRLAGAGQALKKAERQLLQQAQQQAQQQTTE